MKKIEFRTKDGYQYTITDMTMAEQETATEIFIDKEGECFGTRCDYCPIAVPTTGEINDGPIGARGCPTRLSACASVWQLGSNNRVIKSSIKITY